MNDIVSASTPPVMPSNQTHGYLARFENPESLKKAAKSIRQAGYSEQDAFSPFPIEGIDEALGKSKNPLPLIMLLGGIVGGILGYFMQYYAMVIDYPLNVGGRPLHSWPAFIPITFEMIVLFSALSGFFGLMIRCGFPKVYHPVFCVEQFLHASRDQFFIWIPKTDRKFDPYETQNFLQQLGALNIHHVVEAEA